LVGVVLIISGIGLSYVPQINHFLENESGQATYVMVDTILDTILIVIYISQQYSSQSRPCKPFSTSLTFASLPCSWLFFILLLLLFQQGLEGSVIAYVSSVLATTLIVVAWTRSLAPLRFRWNCELLRDFLRYGLKANLGHIAQILNYRLDMFFSSLLFKSC
jgi:O-antigen/teichoic acid export membrane protein